MGKEAQINGNAVVKQCCRVRILLLYCFFGVKLESLPKRNKALEVAIVCVGDGWTQNGIVAGRG